MRIASGLALAVVAVVLVGCGGLSKEQRQANTLAAKQRPSGTVLSDSEMDKLDQDTTVICQTERGTGSHIPRRVCRTLRKTTEQATNARQGMANTNYSGYGATVNAVPVTSP